MSNHVQLFCFNKIEIRTITDNDGEVWFVGKDVAQVLGYEDHSSALNQHCRHSKSLNLICSGKMTELRPGNLLMIKESDVYRLVIRSTKPEAEKFESWIMEDVLPQLRRTGYYQVSGRNPQLPTVFHPVLRFPVVGRQEDLLMKGTRNTYISALNALGFRTAIYKQVLTNNVSRILIGMPVKPFRRLHGLPAGSRRRTRLLYDSNLRRAMDEIEDVSCIQLLEDRPTTFEEIEQVVYQVARTILQYSTMRRVNLLEHIPESDLDELANG